MAAWICVERHEKNGKYVEYILRSIVKSDSVLIFSDINPALCGDVNTLRYEIRNGNLNVINLHLAADDKILMDDPQKVMEDIAKSNKEAAEREEANREFRRKYKVSLLERCKYSNNIKVTKIFTYGPNSSFIVGCEIKNVGQVPIQFDSYLCEKDENSRSIIVSNMPRLKYPRKYTLEPNSTAIMTSHELYKNLIDAPHFLGKLQNCSIRDADRLEANYYDKNMCTKQLVYYLNTYIHSADAIENERIDADYKVFDYYKEWFGFLEELHERNVAKQKADLAKQQAIKEKKDKSIIGKVTKWFKS